MSRINPYLFSDAASAVNLPYCPYDSSRQVAVDKTLTEDYLVQIMSQMEQHQVRLRKQRAVVEEEHQAMQQHSESRLRQCLDSALAPLDAHQSLLNQLRDSAASLGQSSLAHDKQQGLLSLVSFAMQF